MASSTVRRAFNFFQLQNQDDRLELVDEDFNAADSSPGVNPKTFQEASSTPAQSTSDALSIEPRVTVRPPPSTPTIQQNSRAIQMFRIPRLANVIKAFNCLLALINLGWVYSASFDYYNTSSCLRHCRTSYDNVRHRFYVSPTFYDTDDEVVRDALNGTVVPSGTYETTFGGNPQLELQNITTDESAGRFKRSFFDPSEAHANFTQCQTTCDEIIMPMQFPLFACVVHACFTFGFALKEQWSSIFDVIVTFTLHAVDAVFLFVSLICLFYVKNRSLEHQVNTFEGYYHPLSLNHDEVMNGTITFAVFSLLFHVLHTANHRRPERGAEFPSMNHNKTVYRSPLCQSFWFAALMKFLNCFLSFTITVAITMQTFHGLYAENRDRYHYIRHLTVQLLVMFPMAIWHTLVCFTVLPNSNRYWHHCQVQTILGFYIMETIILAFFVPILNLGAAYGNPENQITAGSLMLCLVLWVVDFGLHAFPGHACCDKTLYA